MPQDTRIALFLLAELVAALQANDPDLFKRWLYGGIQDLGEPMAEAQAVSPLSIMERIKRSKVIVRSSSLPLNNCILSNTLLPEEANQ